LLVGTRTKNAQLFKLLSQKVNLSSVKPLLLRIAKDNQVHAEQLQEIGEKIGNPTVHTKECKRKLSVVCENTETILRIVKDKDQILVDELWDFLQILESSGGAAQYLLVQAETFLFMSDQISKLYGMEGEKFNEMLAEMTRDIEGDIYLLEQISDEIQKHQNKNKQKHPVFKYSSPDSWRAPSHSQKSKHVI